MVARVKSGEQNAPDCALIFLSDMQEALFFCKDLSSSFRKIGDDKVSA